MLGKIDRYMQYKIYVYMVSDWECNIWMKPHQLHVYYILAQTTEEAMNNYCWLTTLIMLSIMYWIRMHFRAREHLSSLPLRPHYLVYLCNKIDVQILPPPPQPPTQHANSYTHGTQDQTSIISNICLSRYILSWSQ